MSKQALRDHQGTQIITLLEEVVANNLEREIQMVKSEKGLTSHTHDEIESMRKDELNAVLEQIGFPSIVKKRSGWKHCDS